MSLINFSNCFDKPNTFNPVLEQQIKDTHGTSAYIERLYPMTVG
jgi:hypothetical protein